MLVRCTALAALFVQWGTHVDAQDVAGNSIVTDGAFRFTAVTDRLIRVEYDVKKKFVDEPTLAFLRSRPTGTWIHVNGENDAVTLKTNKVSVRYNRGPLAKGSVVISSLDNQSYTWAYGDDPEAGNLRGTARTLDSGAETLDLNCHHKVSPTMDNSEQHCAWGLVSRSGWAVIDDTGAPVERDGWFAPSGNTTDLSVFLHGLDFSGALVDYFQAAGPPALPPRYALGSMFTRWFNFDSDSVRRLVEDFESRSMPMDAWIFDMNWHIYGPWGSFTWNNNSYPKLTKMLDWMQKQGLTIGANVHEHDGIGQQEATYEEACKALGCTQGKDIPFDLYNKSFADVQENISVRALRTKGDKQGIDFWWIDYQQGEVDTFQKTTIPNINPTLVLNKLRSDGATREQKRSLIVARWGGYGSHRYPVGFSGDQNHDWKGLAYLPYFTSTSANVAFNYWSHDTVGGDRDLAADYELSARWVQTTAWSPVLRFHDKGAGTGDCATTDVCANVVPWDVPTPFFEAIRRATQQREELLPYIYTASWDSMNTGHALVRPCYYENPSDESLYGLDQQYLFGPDMVVSPITSPSGPEAKGFNQALGAVHWSVFAPRSSNGWVDRLNGGFFNAVTASDTYGINDVPGLVRQGAVIPLRPRMRGESSLARAQKTLSALEFRIMPAEAFYQGSSLSSSGRTVDDDGLTLDYLSGKQTITTCKYDFAGATFKIQVDQQGDFVGRPSRVTLRLSFPQLPPVQLLGAAHATLTSEEYDNQLLGSVLTFENVDLTASPSFEVAIDKAYAPSLGNFVGAMGRVRRARYVKDALDPLNVNYGAGRADLTSYALAGEQMSPEFAGTLPQLWQSATAEMQQIVANDGNLKKDQRRSNFVRKMMGLQQPQDDFTVAFV